MAAVEIGARSVAPADGLEGLFDYDVGDVFRDVNTNMDVPSQPKAAARADENEIDTGLGIDEEIKVTKKRAPVPKLDENRLLGPAGIPKLRRITKERLKIKGKGHEYSDVARLLNIYQLWLDDLYPRAKFADGLAIIEKLGHTKRMQTMRREWINEGKPKEIFESLESTSLSPAPKRQTLESTDNEPTTIVPRKRLETPAAIDDDEDLYAATPKPDRPEDNSKRIASTNKNLFASDDEEMGDQPPEDDLDALLAEDQAKSVPKQTSSLSENPSSLTREEDFEDEMEAMTGMGNMW